MLEARFRVCEGRTWLKGAMVVAAGLRQLLGWLLVLCGPACGVPSPGLNPPFPAACHPHRHLFPLILVELGPLPLLNCQRCSFCCLMEVLPRAADGSLWLLRLGLSFPLPANPPPSLPQHPLSAPSSSFSALLPSPPAMPLCCAFLSCSFPPSPSPSPPRLSLLENWDGVGGWG